MRHVASMELAAAYAQARRVARRQAGVLDRQQALDCGLTPAQLVTAVRRGDWTALGRGVLAPARCDDPRDRRARTVAAAVRRAAPGVPSGQTRWVAVGRTAAAVHELPLLTEGEPLVVLRDRGPAPQPPGRLWIPDAQVTHHRNVSLTNLARTAVDIARHDGLLAGVVIVDEALRRCVPREELAQIVAEGSRGRGNAAATTAVRLGRDTAESPLESIGRLRMVQAGIEEPLGQQEVWDARGCIGRVDHVWPAARLIAEADGMAKYRRRYEVPPDQVVLAEKLREDRLRDAGWTVVRYTWPLALHDPEQLVDRVRRGFVRAARAAGR